MKPTGVRLGAMLLAAVLVPACGTGGGGTLSPTIAPGIPSNVEARSGNRQVTVRWDSAATGTTYVVERSFTSGGPYFPISVPTGFFTPTSYVDSGLTNGQDYFYVVSAVNAFGASAHSAESHGIPGFKPVRLASGPLSDHTLAILPDRSVWAWGDDSAGQLGNGFASGTQGAPVPVPDLGDVTAVAVGSVHSLALTTDGTVWSWGGNDLGQLGLGSTSSTPLTHPAAIPGLTEIINVASGTEHSLALRSDGTVWAWGVNAYGQVGNGAGSSAPVLSPTLVVGLTGVTALAAGRYHSMALRNDGTVWVWGSNIYGQLGTGGQTASSVPVQVPNLTGITAITCGAEFSAALNINGILWGWGQNFAGEVGSGAPSPYIASPVQVINLTEVMAIAAGETHMLALRGDGSVWAWGYLFPGSGAIEANFFTPFKVPNLTGITAIAAGQDHDFAVDGAGTLFGWGRNDVGQVGNGTSQTRDLAAPVLNLTDVTALAATGETTVALRSDGTVWAWGGNNWGTLGNGGTSIFPAPKPTQVPGLTTVSAISAGGGHVLALKTDGTVWAWGDNLVGQLGRGSFSPGTGPSPLQVINLTGVIAISAGSGHNLALRNDNSVWSWGGNLGGELGYAPLTNTHTPAPIPGFTGVTTVSAGSGFSLALKAGGALWGWGGNQSGTLALGNTTSPMSTPQQAPGVTGLARISAGSGYALGVDGSGAVWAWGDNHSGQLGIGTVSALPVTSPVAVLNLSGVLEVDCAGHSLALAADGKVWAWGTNSSGQVGSGDESTQPAPVLVVGLPAATGLAAGGTHSAAILPDKTIWSWGGNNEGQLGSPVLINVLVPMAVTQ